jgi:hypothetical protein
MPEIPIGEREDRAECRVQGKDMPSGIRVEGKANGNIASLIGRPGRRTVAGSGDGTRHAK